MRILFIGERSLQNEAILEILTSEVTHEIPQIVPDYLENGIDKLLDNEDHLIIVDLESTSRFNNYFNKIKQFNTSNCLVAISDSPSDSSLDEIPEVEMDYHFSLDLDPKEFLEIITELSNK